MIHYFPPFPTTSICTFFCTFLFPLDISWAAYSSLSHLPGTLLRDLLSCVWPLSCFQYLAVQGCHQQLCASLFSYSWRWIFRGHFRSWIAREEGRPTWRLCYCCTPSPGLHQPASPSPMDKDKGACFPTIAPTRRTIILLNPYLLDRWVFLQLHGPAGNREWPKFVPGRL